MPSQQYSIQHAPPSSEWPEWALTIVSKEAGIAAWPRESIDRSHWSPGSALHAGKCRTPVVTELVLMLRGRFVLRVLFANVAVAVIFYGLRGHHTCAVAECTKASLLPHFLL